MAKNKKRLRKNRMMLYFIDAAHKIMNEEGISSITTRKVADIAGYNSATLYNYFENIDHLIFFAAMKHIKGYVEDVPNYIKDCENALDRYLCIWECFCYHSFSNLEIYNAIFFPKLNDSFENYIKQYYEIFPDELGKQSDKVLPMLLKQNIYDRGIALIEVCVSEGFIDSHDMHEVNDMTVLIYRGMFMKLKNKEANYSIDEAVDRTLKYIKKTIKAYSLKAS